MPRDTIQLNPDKVCLRIALAGRPIKAYAVDMSEKTIHRIKKGARTRLATAHRLAEILGTTVEDLLLPPGRDEVERQLPRNWLYEIVAPSEAPRRYFPARFAIGGDDYIVGQPPSGWQDPLDVLLKWPTQGGRKIVLRRAAHAYLVELHYFEYTPDSAQELDYRGVSACRFFALARTGDDFRKAALSEFNADWVWNDLRRIAMERADIVDVEGHVATAHPRDYVPIARFYRGMIVRRRMEGMRVFGQLHRDFRRALIAYLDGLDPCRVHASTFGLGIQIRIAAVRPAVCDPYWQDDELCIEVDLAWWTPDGCLVPAPWRLEHRERIAAALRERNWAAVNSPGLPPAYPTDSSDDEADPPLAPDLHLPARVAEAVMALYCLAPEQWEVSVGAEA
ncbi:helix-turn-helix transcriptional regulator [Massilia sp. BJB1822]|uniref:helix-turn-helix transcriptional regulator n=1 Tax=Massilia sp. BJB1822 TaxID=2744470 RepID=UPI001594024A|nr:helix-turn-helix transcriptional regulator [Massilia sp. BJB1822]NVD97727.1 helix-turn-helix transcriptional regulator [Massilia sp. BJB1822]